MCVHIAAQNGLPPVLGCGGHQAIVGIDEGQRARGLGIVKIGAVLKLPAALLGKAYEQRGVVAVQKYASSIRWVASAPAMAVATAQRVSVARSPSACQTP